MVGDESTHVSSENPRTLEFVELVSAASGFVETLPSQPFEAVHDAETNRTAAGETLICDKPPRDAQVAADIERKMNFYNGCRLYAKAMAWSFLLSCTIIMEGYDTTLINSFYALPAFRQAYGHPAPGADSSGAITYQISPSWQAALSNASVVSEIIGLFLNGFSTDRFGYHWTMLGALVMLMLFIFPAFFAVNIEMILASQILCGIPWGAFQSLSTTYAAEVMPVQMRAYLLSSVNMCWLIGQLLGVAIMRRLVDNTSPWSYRIPFGLQWVFAVVIFLGVIFAPESPWWLVRHERLQKARKVLLRLVTTRFIDFNVDKSLAMMKHTDDVEKHIHKRSSSFLDCFKYTNLRRTEICCLVFSTQAMSGSTLTGFAAYFYEQAGVDVRSAFSLAVGMYALAILGGIIAWFLLSHFGRRRLYLTGLVVSFWIFISAGIVGTLPSSRATSWAAAGLLILLTFVYDMTIGPVCYVLVAEIPSTRLRVKSVVLARATYNAISIAMNIGTSHMLNPVALNWRSKTCFFYAVTTALSFIWCYFRLPEPKGLSYLELDILFERKASTRKFKEFQASLEKSGYFSITRSQLPESGWQGY
ncbi:sugar transporter-domain-containing protein [Trichoderma asperelloides]|nr:sugar transporter-domain-containing protein [Trichoderma asperelloides]